MFHIRTQPCTTPKHANWSFMGGICALSCQVHLEKDMPIRPENRKRYPKNWKEISLRIRFHRAKGRCECDGECGEHEGRRCGAFHGEDHPVTQSKVILTTAHLSEEVENCSDENLKAMCQKCHNRYDREMRARGIKERAQQAMKDAHVGELFED